MNETFAITPELNIITGQNTHVSAAGHEEIGNQDEESEDEAKIFYLTPLLTNVMAHTPVPCSGPNTEIDRRGYCVCTKSFHGDMPLNARGCWKCPKRCHIEADCNFPGICKCRSGFIGDGVNTCVRPAPSIESFTPNSVRPGDSILIRYSLRADYVPYSAFCRFSSFVVTTEVLANRTLKCTIPEKVPVRMKLEISFDSLEWSQSTEFLNCVIEHKENFSPNVILLFLLAVALSLTLMQFLSSKRRRVQLEESSTFSPVNEFRDHSRIILRDRRRSPSVL